MCPEFGNWGLPDPGRDLDNPADGSEPWWFETGHDWGEGVMYPHGVKHRFADWSLDRVFGDLRCVRQARRSGSSRGRSSTRSRGCGVEPVLAGYVITELTDVHWEFNGLLDMRRNRRVFHNAFSTINADTVIVPSLGAAGILGR